MQGPHFTYLTRSYVEWLGLEPFPYYHPDPICIWVGENATKPLLVQGIDTAVVYNHALYLRERDGLAWRLLSTIDVVTDIVVR